ncbi:uncharacterized protein LOC144113652 isoform X2 [Amblyomma americanum]
MADTEIVQPHTQSASRLSSWNPQRWRGGGASLSALAYAKDPAQDISEVHGHARLNMKDDSYIQDSIPGDILSSTRKISKTDIEYVSDEVSEWRELARLLPEDPITEEELHSIKRLHHSSRDRVRSVLELWRHKCHGSATLGSLVESLHLLGYSELAMTLKP